MAAENGHEGCAKLLVEAKAAVDAADQVSEAVCRGGALWRRSDPGGLARGEQHAGGRARVSCGEVAAREACCRGALPHHGSGSERE